MSASDTLANPSMEDPSKPMPSSKAPSSSAGAIATDLRYPSTSVNHNRTKRMSRSSSVRRTNSCCRSMLAMIQSARFRGVTSSPACLVRGSRGTPARPEGGGPDAALSGQQLQRLVRIGEPGGLDLPPQPDQLLDGLGDGPDVHIFSGRCPTVGKPLNHK